MRTAKGVQQPDGTYIFKYVETMIHLLNDFYFVPLPEDAIGVKLETDILRWRQSINGYSNRQILPPGFYTLICTPSKITEDEAAEIAVNHEGLIYQTITESLTSLLTARGCEGNGCIIKKQ